MFKEKAFKSTINDKHINNIVVTGLVSNGCVQTACSDGIKLGYTVNLISDAHSTFHKDAEQAIIDWNQKLKVKGANVITTDDFLKELEQI